MGKVNRNYKAGLFTHLFGKPETELELYNAFSPVYYPPDTPVEDLTLADVLYMDRVNDLSFSIDGKLVVFFEHSSTINENIPLRYLTYCGRVYEKLYDNAAMYSERRMAVHTPEFYVLYNGMKPFPEKTVYRLSDSYAKQPDGEKPLELAVTAYNVNKGFNEDIVKRSETLYGYVTLVAAVREHEKTGLNRPDAVARAVKDCIAGGILNDYLKRNASEVNNMLIQDWDWDTAKSVWQKEAREEGREEGIAQGIKQGIVQGIVQGANQERIETAKRLLREGLPVELVARASLLTVEEVQKLKNTASLVNENAPDYCRT